MSYLYGRPHMYDERTKTHACPACDQSLGGSHTEPGEAVPCPSCGTLVSLTPSRRQARPAAALRALMEVQSMNWTQPNGDRALESLRRERDEALEQLIDVRSAHALCDLYLSTAQARVAQLEDALREILRQCDESVDRSTYTVSRIGDAAHEALKVTP
jgi:hypothetical protein